MLKKLCQCIGLSSIILVMNYGDLLGGGADVRMHVPFGVAGICLAQVADILLLGLAIFAILAAFQRTRFYPVVRLLFAIVIPPYVLERTQALYPFDMQDGVILVFAVVWAAVLLALFFRFNSWYRRVMRAADAVGVFFAIFAFCSIVQLLFVTLWKPGPHQHNAAWAQAAQPPRQHPLVVWIVFDELSYEQIFGDRAHDLQLPNFDALRSESTVFTDAQPIGYKTVKVLPSLLSGQIVDDFRFGFNNSFKVHYTGVHGWHPLNGSETVFADAQKNGWRTAAVGWYNPYCTIYGDAIDDCYWMNLDKIDGPMAQRNSFWRNTLSPLQEAAIQIESPDRAGRDICDYDVRQRYQTHIDLEKHTLQLLQTGQADFVFLHMDIPHSPNIWSRIDNNYTQTCGSSYLDSLALVDRELGKVLAVLQASPRWKDTTLIVEGDHGWRVALWQGLPSWTDEDDEASHGVFDPRPAVIIHQAGQTQPQTNATAWSLLNVHSVVEQVLHGQPVRF